MIEPQFVYTTIEILEELNISKHNHANFSRRLQRLGRKHNIEKIDNNYIFEGKIIIEYLKLNTNDNVVQSSFNRRSDVVETLPEVKVNDAPTTQKKDVVQMSSNVQQKMQEQIKALYESNKVLNNTISLLNDEIEKLKEPRKQRNERPAPVVVAKIKHKKSREERAEDTKRPFYWLKPD